MVLDIGIAIHYCLKLRDILCDLLKFCRRSMSRRQTKRGRGASASTSAAAPPPLTPEEIRLNTHRDEIKRWSHNLERGLVMPGGELFEKYHATIRALGWSTLTAVPVKPIIPLVQEFYAQLHTTEENKVTVFGTEVEFTEDEINRVLGIGYFPRDDFFTRLRNGDAGVTYEEIAHSLSLGKGLKGSRNRVRISSLSDEARLWRKFINGRILGKGKDSITNIEVQQMLFSICLHKAFNVGAYVYDKINSIRNQLRNDGFGHLALSYPSIITMLCSEVPRRPEFFVVNNLHVIDESYVKELDEIKPCIKDFHRIHWSGRGAEDWVEPVEERSGDEDDEHEQPPFVWTQERYDGVHQRIDDLNARYDQGMAMINRQLQNIDIKNDIYHDQCSTFFRNMYGQFPPPPPPPMG